MQSAAVAHLGTHVHLVITACRCRPEVNSPTFMFGCHSSLAGQSMLAFYLLAVRKWSVQSITTLALCLSLHTGQQARQGALLVSMHVNSSAAGPGLTNEHPLKPLGNAEEKLLESQSHCNREQTAATHTQYHEQFFRGLATATSICP